MNRKWDRHAIRAEIARRGSSLTKLAAEARLSPSSMSWALWSRPHLRANKAIAEFLGVSLQELWPEWFDADGKVISTKPIARPSAEPSAWPTPPSMPRGEAA
jgi:Ner family transcriptional regulator